jgi:hypothetical protein
MEQSNARICAVSGDRSFVPAHVIRLAILGVMLACAADARETGSELFEWFMSIADRDGDPCIHMGRPHVVGDDDWRCIDGLAPCAIVIDGEWAPIAGVAIVDEQNRIGPAVVWLTPHGKPAATARPASSSSRSFTRDFRVLPPWGPEFTPQIWINKFASRHDLVGEPPDSESCQEKRPAQKIDETRDRSTNRPHLPLQHKAVP